MKFVLVAVALASLIRPVPAASLKEFNPPQSPDAKRPLAIVGATLIDGRGGRPIPDAIVVLRGEKILAVGPRRSTRIPGDAETFDATGLTLLPGFIDSHFHIERSYDLPRLFM